MIRLAIESARGSMELPSFGTNGVVFAPGPAGLGIPPDLTEWEESPAGGGRLRSVRAGMRDATLPVTILGQSSDEVREFAEQLRRVTRAAAKPVFVVTLTNGERYKLPFIRVGGGEDGLPYEGATELDWALEVRCGAPYWVSERSRQIGPIRVESSEGLLPDLAELHVSHSNAFGEINILNTGDVESPVTWVITGPGGPVSVDVDGAGFTLTDPLDVGEVITVEYRNRTWSVTDQTGANRYALLGTAPKFPRLQPGTSRATISMTAATPESSVAGYYQVRRELIL
ncbi:hypothetical protein [Microbacterium halotolerans]|uniref:hypothetical protein n=1 Tax=Microbacterium halotolerans TaxID=246613 RepID=UPI000E6ACA17|nr:hypothetical protein [Microbacterium halotolerans]